MSEVLSHDRSVIEGQRSVREAKLLPYLKKQNFSLDNRRSTVNQRKRKSKVCIVEKKDNNVIHDEKSQGAQDLPFFHFCAVANLVDENQTNRDGGHRLMKRANIRTLGAKGI